MVGKHSGAEGPVRVITYRRVSTQEQGDSGAGLEAQQAKIDVEVERRGWIVVRELQDVASGKNMTKRPQLAAALVDLAAGHADLLVVAKLDRLSRSMLDFAGIIGRAKVEGWALACLDPDVDTSTANGKLLANVIMAMAEWERELIGERTKDALAAVRARGTKLGRKSNVDAATLGAMRTMRAGGSSYPAIAKMLNDAGVPTAQGGKSWYPATVKQILDRAGELADVDQLALEGA